MVISVASGKGGTGKTLVATSLSQVTENSVYLDCDVEEPNGHILLNPEIVETETVYKLLPEINYSLCNFCGKCSQLCEFNALINLKEEIIVLGEMCHSCGVCSYFCPQKAITEINKSLGIIRKGTVEKAIFIDGTLNIGEISAAPLIKQVKKQIVPSKINIIDSPPGTSCSMLEAVKDSDFCVLVTESTPFGLQDLKLAIGVLEKINLRFGVVINKYDDNFNELDNFLTDNNYKILLKIPYDKQIAEYYSNGKLPIEISKYKIEFEKLSNFILRDLVL